MHRLARLRHADPAPISGLDALLANQVFFYDDPERFTDSVNKLCDELEQRIEKKVGVRTRDHAADRDLGMPHGRSQLEAARRSSRAPAR